MFRLRDCSEDDTIFVDFNRISSDMYYPSLLAQGRFLLLFILIILTFSKKSSMIKRYLIMVFALYMIVHSVKKFFSE